MVIRNIKKSEDIDIVVSRELFEKCKQEGWTQVDRTYPDKIGNIYLRRDCIELYLDVNCGNFNPTLEELCQRADIVEGIAFASLEDVIKFKQSYNKPKHKEDVQKIKDYLQKNK